MSKILIIGGTGYAGTAIAKEAASRGHQVTALSRNAPAAPLPGVSYQQGAAADAAALVADADVIVGALSPRQGSQNTLVDTYGKIADAARARGKRLLVVGGFSSLRPAPDAPRFAESGQVPPEFAAEATEMNAVLVSLETRTDDLDWVFISPAAAFGGYLPTGEPLGTYKTAEGVAIFDENGNSAIEGADFALAVVDEIDTPTYHRGQLSFSN